MAGIRFSPDAEVWQALTSARQGEPALKQAATWAWCELGRPEDLGLVKVPAGEFLMGSKEGEGPDAESPQHALYLPTFYIGKTPVTVERYREFLAKSGYLLEKKEVFEGYNKRADHPVVIVSWHDSLAFAEWQGFGLPSEAEWEKAARGTDGRTYPWGNEWKLGHANTRERRVWRFPLPQALRRRTSSGGTTPVRQYSPQGDSPYGCVDMSGNVWEWTRSCWGTDREPGFKYPYEPLDGREDLKADANILRVVRGGAFDYTSRNVRCAYRYRNFPDYRFDVIGFRVVLSPFSSDL